MTKLSRADRARIKVDLDALETFREACTDSGIRRGNRRMDHSSEKEVRGEDMVRSLTFV
jgi:hypothetical protein